ncbi:LysR substrate-binding domain-containing protein [Eoetvoesiella caeni]|uniref:DNA-binding transcriptional LysR family regulator n=1 Tax=Eoetvoesiella caeni TaxID=645616 RepID=A0A366GZS7_9BURK|nr:LysR substrate-binding domain-containing protein [Eoetvoesiella caeni]MCI2811254.1 LysR substrate-binding domain-containing protein [Eoetvoesiella caeni]NYT57137.1 LysR family transcriptional regulator [Eoetvoesiella caeni]RBP33649.1 DNA-binding transcriptional LysR family regulator [Eoetvoesiella caeni]
MSPDPKSLRLFISVLKHGTIAAAAEHEHTAAAAISRRISDLEEQLGVALVVRSNKGITPTAAGQALLNMSHRVLHDLDSIRTQMHDYAVGMKGYIRIVANMSAIHQFMPKELSAFLSDNPLVQIDLEERVSTVIAQSIADNNADVGVLVMDHAIEGIEFLPYKEDDLVVIVPESHSLAGKGRVGFAETLIYDYVGLPAGSQMNLQLMRVASELGQIWRCRFQVSSYDALCLMVESDLGMGVLPRRIAMSYAKALGIKLLTLDEPWAHRQLHVCIRSYDALSPAARLLVDRMTGSRTAHH